MGLFEGVEDRQETGTMLVAALLCVVGLSLVAGQQPRPCDTPPQWEGRLMRRDFSKNFTEYAKITYDETNRRVREIAEMDIGSDREVFDRLYLHNENKEYRLDLKTRKCNVTTLTRPFIPFGLPRDATYDGEANVGPVNIPGEHATVINFHGHTEDGGQYYGEVTFPDCVPVSTGYYSNRTGAVHSSFYDITAGIPDPNVFTPPSECQG